MSIFKPSNMSPNFDEVDISKEFDLSFQIHASGSYINAYQIDFLPENNYEDDEDGFESIIYTKRGNFDKSYQNGDTVSVLVNLNTEAPGKFSNDNNYRWRLRLYQDTISDSPNYSTNLTKLNNHEIVPTYVGQGMVVGSTRNVIWANNYNSNMMIDYYVECQYHSYNSDFNIFKKVNGIRPKYFTTTSIDNTTIPQATWKCMKIDTDQFNKSDFEFLSSGNCYVAKVDNSGVIDTTKICLIQNIVKDNGGNFWFVPYRQTYIVEPPEGEVNQYSGLFNSFNLWNTSDHYTIIYKQRLQIADVIKNVGENAFTQLIFYNSFKYSLKHGQPFYIYNNPGLHYELYKEYGQDYTESNMQTKTLYINSGLAGNSLSDLDNDSGANLGKWALGTTTSTEVYTDVTVISPIKCYLLINQDRSGSKPFYNDIISKGFRLSSYNPSDGQTIISCEKYFNVYPGLSYNLYYSYKEDNSTTTHTYELGSGIIGGTSLTNTNVLQSHQIGSSNYYNMFLQSNQAIKPDKYRPIYLEFEYEGFKKSGLIINSGDYNRKTTVDTMNDSQYYVTLYSPGGMFNNYHDYLMPQTDYKIYTQFVDAIPENYFYARLPMAYELNLKYLYDQTQSALDNGRIKYRDIYIKAQIPNNISLTSNTIRYYKYTVYSSNEVIYDSGYKYDLDLSCEVYGLQPNTAIEISLIIEDNLGTTYDFKQNYVVDYTPEIHAEGISLSYNCENRSNVITLSASESGMKGVVTGNVSIDSNNIVNIPYGENSLTYNKINDQDYLIIDDNSTLMFDIQFDQDLIDRGQSVNICTIRTQKQIENQIQYYDYELQVQFNLLHSTSLDLNTGYLHIYYWNDTLLDGHGCVLPDVIVPQNRAYAYQESNHSTSNENVYTMFETKKPSDIIPDTLVKEGKPQVPDSSDYKYIDEYYTSTYNPDLSSYIFRIYISPNAQSYHIKVKNLNTGHTTSDEEQE